jgi:Leucine-rich repeat (LRR) protein
MECFIVEKGVERKAELEDILPLLDDRTIQTILRDAEKSDIDLSFVLGNMPDEMKNLVCRNLLSRNRGRIERNIKQAESTYKKNSGYFKNERAKLFSLIGENIKWNYFFPDCLFWKDTKSKEKKGEWPDDSIKHLINEIESACSSGELWPLIYEMPEENVRKAFETFKDRRNELQKIRTLRIGANYIPAAVLLFEAGGLKELDIYGKFTGTWPSFMENCGALTSISLNICEGLTELPSWIRNAVSLQSLSISSHITSIPDWIGDMQSLEGLYISEENLKTIPDSIGNLTNLSTLYICLTDIEKLPDSIGNLLSLKDLLLRGNENLTSLSGIENLKNLNKFELLDSRIKTLPDWIGNLHNLAELSLARSDIEKLPECIGNLGNLTALSLKNCKNIKCLPDSIGRLKNLADLNLYGSAIEKLPDTTADCASLECINVCNTSISSFPDFGSLTDKIRIKQTIEEVLPKKRGISRLSYCNYYYTLVETILRFSEEARAAGLLELENELETISAGFLKTGLRLMVDGTDAAIIRHLLTLLIKREHHYYIKKLMKIAMEGILCILNGDDPLKIGLKLASLSGIKNDPFSNACEKCLADGDSDAFYKFNFKAQIRSEREREEIRFIRRVLELSEISRREGWLEVEKYLDNEGISAGDVFEYGLLMAVDNRDYEDIDKHLTLLITRETDPVCKNFALAKKDAVRMICEGCSTRIILLTLLAYFDEDVEKSFTSEIDEL